VDTVTRLSSARFPPLRAHQGACVAVFDSQPDAGRFHFVLPPGAGKTLLGAVLAQRLGRKVLVLVPNTAIQDQWLRLWKAAGGVTVGDDRSLSADVTVLTYQALATFDDDKDSEASAIARLHPNALEVIEALHGDQRFTLVLDEAHHLAARWGQLLAEVLEQAHSGRTDGPAVIALTATPRDSLSPAEAELVDGLFGPVLYAVSTPALVREGVLAPFREFAWFVAPTPGERQYLAQSALRWRELITSVTAEDFARPGLLEYLDATWVRHEGVSWSHIERTRPELARALVRGAHNTLLALPEGARVRDEHRQAMDAEDWAAILADYGRHALAETDPPSQAWERLRAGMSSVGWTLTRNGARRGQSPVDRVLARSAAKSVAAGLLLFQEHQVRGDRLRAIVLTDFENVGATPSADLRSVLSRHAGSAWEALTEVQRANPGLHVVLVTGSSVGGTREVLETLAPEGTTVVAREDGLCQIEGFAGPREWVPYLTAAFQAGRIDVLVGTRGLLGEGWDAPAANVVVDLTAATTSTAVVQIRGRAIRLDPQRRDKLSHIWSVVAVDDTHPRGDLDYRRLVAKHRGYLAPDAHGRIIGGVEHLDSRCNAFAPPPAAVRDAINADALTAAGDLEQSRDSWQIGAGYRDVVEVAVRVRATRAIGVPEVAVRTPAAWPWVAGGVGAAGGGAAAAVAGAPTAGIAALTIGGAGLGWLVEAVAGRVRAARVAARLGADGMLIAVGRAVADAMSRGLAGQVRVDPDARGEWSVRLDDADAAQSAAFAQAIEQILSPVDFPRYLISRRVRRGVVMWHAVPDAFGVNKAGATGFAEQWFAYVSRGELLYTGSPEGAGIADSVRGLDPLELTTAMYSQWQ
jgi:superfamily II DNA or RNA helicase